MLILHVTRHFKRKGFNSNSSVYNLRNQTRGANCLWSIEHWDYFCAPCLLRSTNRYWVLAKGHIECQSVYSVKHFLKLCALSQTSSMIMIWLSVEYPIIPPNRVWSSDPKPPELCQDKPNRYFYNYPMKCQPSLSHLVKILLESLFWLGKSHGNQYGILTSSLTLFNHVDMELNGYSNVKLHKAHWNQSRALYNNLSWCNTLHTTHEHLTGGNTEIVGWLRTQAFKSDACVHSSHHRLHCLLVMQPWTGFLTSPGLTLSISKNSTSFVGQLWRLNTVIPIMCLRQCLTW